MRCDECRWWDECEDRKGECRRTNPAPAFREAIASAWLWPSTLANEFCGEFQPKSTTNPFVIPVSDERAQRIREEEREACAQVVESCIPFGDHSFVVLHASICKTLAKIIRNQQ